MSLDIKIIINKFLNKKDMSAEEVSEIITSLEKDSRFTWRDMGDLSNNRGRINIVTSKDHTLVERVTNAIDACIEKKSQDYPDIGKKENITEVQNFLKNNELWNEKKEVSVEIFPLEKTKKTNFLFRDKGTGVENEKMPYTILYFNSRQKTDKDYLRGSFGQGGSTVCRYSEYTAIITNSKEKTSFTIIRYDKKRKNYKYLVDKNNLDNDYKQIPYQEQPEKNYLPPYIDNFDFSGTLIIHTSYDLYKTSFIDYYNIFEENLFNSYLPYRLCLLNKKDNNERPMHGLKNRLEERLREKKVEKGSSTTFALKRNEKAKMVYYYLKELDTKSYLSDARKHSIFVTLNGQTHTKLRKALISDARLPKLMNKLIVEINCNQLSDDLKDNLFDSSRQKLDKEYEEILEKSVIDFLSNNEFLQQEQLRLEEEERKKEIGENTEFYRKELSKMIENFSPGKYNVRKPGEKPGQDSGRTKGGSKPKSIELFDVPTYFNIINKNNPISASIDGRCLIKIESNITNRSFWKNNCYIEIDKNTENKIDSQIQSIRDGRVTIPLLFKDVTIGEKIPIKFFLKSGNHTINLETEKRYIEIVKRKRVHQKGSISIDAPHPIEVYKDGKNKEKYIKYGWHENEKISKVERGNRMNIYVNMSHSKLEEFLENIKTEKSESLRSEYFLGMTLASFLQNEDETFKKFNEGSYDEAEEIKDKSLLIAAQTLFMNFRKQRKD